MDGASIGHGDGMSGLRISAVTVTPVAFADPPLLNSVGVHEPFALRAVVEVSTDEGLASLGETYACDTHWPWKTEDVVAGEPLSLTGGAIRVPDAPGLGVELDRDALARLHEQYLRCGLRNRDDTGYMRRVVPGYERKQPRW